MTRTQFTALKRLYRPLVLAALCSVSAGALAGTFVTSRAGIEYVPQPVSQAPATHSTAGASSTLGNEGAAARGKTDYVPATVGVTHVVGAIDSLASRLVDQREPRTSALTDERDRAGNRYVPATYDSFGDWWNAMTDASANEAPVAFADTAQDERFGTERESPPRN